MKRGAFCLALFGWPMYGAEDVSAKAPVALYVKFDRQPPDSATYILQRELHAILAPVGFDFEWRPTDDRNEVWAALAVVTFKGHCDARDLVRANRFAGGALGWTHVSDGRILPFTEVDCDRIGAFLESQLFALPLPVREKVFQRAIARVLAHELYHVFTQTAAHAPWGVAKAEFSTEELLSESFRFQNREARALRRWGAQAWQQFAMAAHGTAPH
jgi:hypothetical protein